MGKVKIVSASAGSGKTYSLAYEYVRNVIADPSLYSHILAVTFTNKATEEMKQRILSGINDLANCKDTGYRDDLKRDLGYADGKITERAAEVRSRILHDYSRFSVLTIDKFFQRIIRAFLRELGIGVNFNLELPVESLLGSATDRLINEISGNDALRGLVTSLVDERMDEGKSWDVKNSITQLGREIFSEDYKRGLSSALPHGEPGKAVHALVAAAEKGKRRIIAAAEEMQAFLDSHGLSEDDFSNKDKGVAGYVRKTAGGVIGPYGTRVTDALNDGKWCTANAPNKAVIDSLAPELTALLGKICRAYDEETALINTASLVRRNYKNFVLLGDLRRKISEVAQEENIVHISEINDMLSRLVAGNDAPFIFEKAGNRFSHFMIDEFQDTSAMQWNNFVPLLENAVAQSEHTPVLLVGDVKQSIYRWRGGDWSILAEKAPAQFGEVRRTSLRHNYRSRRELVGFMNAIVGGCAETESGRIEETLAEAEAAGRISEKLKGSLSGAMRTAYSDYLQEPAGGKEGGYATVTCYDKTKGAKTLPPVIETIEELQDRGYAARDIAVLVRTNNQGAQVAHMLLERKKAYSGSRFNYDVITQDALVIGKSPIANFVAACMRLSADTDDAVSRAQYNHRLGRDFGLELSGDEKEFFRKLGLQSPEEAFESVVMRFGLSGCTDEVSYLQAFHRQVLAFTEKNIADIPLFLQWWDDKGRSESIAMHEGADAITIDTIHRSKGLGYKAVIIPYCDWSLNTKPDSLVWSRPREGSAAEALGAFPVNYVKEMSDSAFSEDYYREYVMSHIDNLNLFYVAVTRAKEELHIMMPRVSGKKTGKGESIDGLVRSSLAINGGKAAIGSLEGIFTESGDKSVASFGKPQEAGKQPASESPLHLDFTTTDISGRVKLKLSGQRYFDEGAPDGRLSPRNYGILMHGLFEQASDLADIERNIGLLRDNGSINGEEAERLAANVGEAMLDVTVRGWFDGSWDVVRNEGGIIVPRDRGYRPDRVMIRGGKAEIVDYKFGGTENRGYAEQMSRYMSILTEMGYREVSGYIWYVNMKKVVSV